MAVVMEDGMALYPVAVQDIASGRILMMAFANQEALDRTRRERLAYFYSRSRHALWKKGERSGHLLPVEAVWGDCDDDSFVYRARPLHPVCHRNTPGCFDAAFAQAPAPSETEPLRYLQARVAERAEADPAASYTARLLTEPLDRLLKKIGEEATEVILAAYQDRPALVWESADLLYHLSVLWHRRGVDLAAILAELERRHQSAGG